MLSFKLTEFNEFLIIELQIMQQKYKSNCRQSSEQCAGVKLSSTATSCIILIWHLLQCDNMVKSYASTGDLSSFFFFFFLRMCPQATQHNAYSCYLMSCLVNIPLSSVMSRRLRCARLCLRDGSAYTSFLRIHTQGSSRQSKLWGETATHALSV